MPTSRRFRPAIHDRLEDRAIPSAGLAAAAPFIAAHPQALNLVGLIQGTTLTPGSIPDSGTTTFFNGSGTVAPLGNVHMMAWSQQGGFIRITPEGGFLDLANRQGSVMLQFSRTVDHSVGNPGPFHFKIVAGSGAYRGAQGSGTLTIAYGGPIGVVPAPIGEMPGQTGSFVMAINEPMPPIALPL